MGPSRQAEGRQTLVEEELLDISRADRDIVGCPRNVRRGRVVVVTWPTTSFFVFTRKHNKPMEMLQPKYTTSAYAYDMRCSSHPWL